MNARPLACPRCQAALAGGLPELSAIQRCPACAAELEVAAFPALFHFAGQGRAGEATQAEGEAACFYHPGKRAAVPCDACGKFLCALCDMEMADKHYCPTCLESGGKKGKIKTLERSRTRHDSIVLCLVLGSVLFWPLAVVLCPVALGLTMRHWNSPPSLVANTKLRLGICAVLAALLLCASAAFWISLARSN